MEADPVEREAVLTRGEPFYVPPFVGSKGSAAIRLDHPRTDREDVAGLIAIGYCLIAPDRLAATITGPPTPDSSA